MAHTDHDFWSRQRVFLTGHTGFKGAWLGLLLEQLGAQTTGLALPPDTQPNLATLLGHGAALCSLVGDIRNREAVERAVAVSDPTIAIHMAAQPLVRRSYREPVDTIHTNVTGTAIVLDTLRHAPSLKAVLVVTTDKVYRNLEDGRAFREDDALGGHDPYSASKAAAELVTAAWAHSFFRASGISMAAARAGNVVGGGDWSQDRLIPDVWRAAKSGVPVMLRYPNATRPWQHVLDPLYGYLAYAKALATKKANIPEALNFGPLDGKSMTVAEVADIVSAALGCAKRWMPERGTSTPEKMSLALDTTAAIRTLDWRPRLAPQSALDWTARWYGAFDAGADPRALTLGQIREYEELVAADVAA